MNLSCQASLGSQVTLTRSVAARMHGLLGRRQLEPGEGMMFETSGPIHTFFMRFPIDVLFLDRQKKVVGQRENLKPFRLAWRPGATMVIELPAGTIALTGTRKGDQVEAKEAQE